MRLSRVPSGGSPVTFSEYAFSNYTPRLIPQPPHSDLFPAVDSLGN